jgi:hypothetical protein
MRPAAEIIPRNPVATIRTSAQRSSVVRREPVSRRTPRHPPTCSLKVGNCDGEVLTSAAPAPQSPTSRPPLRARQTSLGDTRRICFAWASRRTARPPAATLSAASTSAKAGVTRSSPASHPGLGYRVISAARAWSRDDRFRRRLSHSTASDHGTPTKGTAAFLHAVVQPCHRRCPSRAHVPIWPRAAVSPAAAARGESAAGGCKGHSCRAVVRGLTDQPLSL